MSSLWKLLHENAGTLLETEIRIANLKQSTSCDARNIMNENIKNEKLESFL